MALQPGRKNSGIVLAVEREWQGKIEISKNKSASGWKGCGDLQGDQKEARDVPFEWACSVHVGICLRQDPSESTGTGDGDSQ